MLEEVSTLTAYAANYELLYFRQGSIPRQTPIFEPKIFINYLQNTIVKYVQLFLN